MCFIGNFCLFYWGRRIKKSGIAVIIFLFFSFGLLIASGKKEDQFEYIDRMIAEQDYSQALALLSDYIVKNPQDLDSAQRRISKILAERDEFNKTADDLLAVILEDPENNELKLTLIQDLEKREIVSGTRDFIEQTKVAAEFAFFRSRYEKIMTSGSQLIQDKKFVDAANMYYTGFTLYRDNFFQQEYDEVFLQPIKDALADIADKLPRYAQAQNDLQALVDAFLYALENGSALEAQTAFAAVSRSMSTLASIRNSILHDGWAFQTGFTELSAQNPAITEASFLPFVMRFTLGRSSDINSGIVGSIDAQWQILTETMKTAVYDVVQKKWHSFASLTDVTVLSADISRLETLQNGVLAVRPVIDLGIQVNNLYALLDVSAEKKAAGLYSEYEAGLRFAQRMGSLAASQTEIIKSFAALKKSYGEYRLPDEIAKLISAGNQSTIDYLKDAAQSFSGLNERTEQNAREADTAFASYTEQFPAATANDYSFQYNQVSALCEKAIAESTEGQTGAFFAVLKYGTTGSSALVAQYTGEYNTASDLLHGVSAQDDERVFVYPAESKLQMEKSLVSIAADIKNIQQVYDEVVLVPQQIVSLDEYGAGLAAIQRDIRMLQKIQTDGRQLITKAQEQILQANLALQEAEVRYNQAVQALRRNEYTEARSSLQLARQRYSQSLDLQESVERRSSSDAKLLKLGNDINRAENEVVITQVRSLITQAKSAYYTGNFESADRYLTQAKSRWEVTNVEENTEITQWLTLTGTAISMKTGRVIPPTAPVYPEMSQLMSAANQMYEEGRRLLDQGKRQDARAVLETAQQRIREIQLVYPLNQEASLLSMRIDRLIDPRAFDATFKQKYDHAVANYKNPSLQQTAYADLLDLYQMNPDYPGIKNTVNTVEIYLGIRLPPPNPRSIRESNNLIQQARAAVNSTNEITVRTALAQLDQALKLTPDNEEATLLKDRLQNRLGGQAVVVLSAESEKLYQQAVAELQKNNVITAAALTAQLMKKPESKKSPKVLDLQQRINVLTGQTN